MGVVPEILLASKTNLDLVFLVPDSPLFVLFCVGSHRKMDY